MKGCRESHQPLLIELMQLIERQEKPGPSLTCRNADLGKELNRVAFELAAVGYVTLRPGLNAKADAAI